MLKNVLSKIFYALLTLLGVVSLVFFLFNVLPGDPAQMMLGQNENSDQLAMVKKNMVLIYQFPDNSPFTLMICLLFLFIQKRKTIYPILLQRSTMPFPLLKKKTMSWY